MEELLNFFNSIFGIEADELSTLHILARCILIYVIGIALVRFGKKRFIGKMTAFDTILQLL